MRNCGGLVTRFLELPNLLDKATKLEVWLIELEGRVTCMGRNSFEDVTPFAEDVIVCFSRTDDSGHRRDI